MDTKCVYKTQQLARFMREYLRNMDANFNFYITYKNGLHVTSKDVHSFIDFIIDGEEGKAEVHKDEAIMMFFDMKKDTDTEEKLRAPQLPETEELNKLRLLGSVDGNLVKAEHLFENWKREEELAKYKQQIKELQDEINSRKLSLEALEEAKKEIEQREKKLEHERSLLSVLSHIGGKLLGGAIERNPQQVSALLGSIGGDGQHFMSAINEDAKKE